MRDCRRALPTVARPWLFVAEKWWNRVVAPRRPRMATEDPEQTKPQPPPKTEPLNCACGVLGTRRVKPAAAAREDDSHPAVIW